MSSICELWELAMTCLKVIIMVCFSQANICDARTCMLLSRAIDKIEFALRVMMYLPFPVSIERTCAVSCAPRAFPLSMSLPLNPATRRECQRFACANMIWVTWRVLQASFYADTAQPWEASLGRKDNRSTFLSNSLYYYNESYSSSNNVSCFKNVLKIRFRSTFLCCYFRCDVIAVDVTLVWRVRATDAWCSCLSSVFRRSATNEWRISCVWV